MLESMCRVGEQGLGHRDGNGTPCRHRRGDESTGVSIDIDDTRVSGGEEDEQRRGKEDGDDRTNGLGEPLLLGRRAEEETDAEIANKVGSLVSSHGGERTAEQVEALSLLRSPALTLGSTTEDDLRGLGSGGQRRNVRDTGALDGEEREEECKDDREDASACRHAKLHTEDNDEANDG